MELEDFDTHQSKSSRQIPAKNNLANCKLLADLFRVERRTFNNAQEFFNQAISCFRLRQLIGTLSDIYKIGLAQNQPLIFVHPFTIISDCKMVNFRWGWLS